MKNRLPFEFHEVLERALADMRLCQQTSGVKLDSHVWYRPTASGCVVCLAGAVLYREGLQDAEFRRQAEELGLETQHCFPNALAGRHAITSADARRLYVVNSVRDGNIDNAVEGLVHHELIGSDELNLLDLARLHWLRNFQTMNSALLPGPLDVSIDLNYYTIDGAFGSSLTHTSRLPMFERYVELMAEAWKQIPARVMNPFRELLKRSDAIEHLD